MRDNILMNTFTFLRASPLSNVSKILYTSSGCVYRTYRQTSEKPKRFEATDAFPADPTIFTVGKNSTQRKCVKRTNEITEWIYVFFAITISTVLKEHTREDGDKFPAGVVQKSGGGKQPWKN